MDWSNQDVTCVTPLAEVTRCEGARGGARDRRNTRCPAIRIMPRIARESAHLRVYRQASRTWSRAAIRRARRCRRQGETINASDLLAPMCHRYTYEFDIVELGEGKRSLFTTSHFSCARTGKFGFKRTNFHLCVRCEARHSH